ncbi:MAG: helix-turn-helix domain-containing protein [Chitinophagales bacterium]
MKKRLKFRQQNSEHSKESLSSNPEESEKESEETRQLFEEDKIWLQKVESFIQNNLSNDRYTIRTLAMDVIISERQLRRRMKKLTGLTPAQYLKKARLGKAHQLISSKKYKTITQVAYAVGFKDVGAFRSNFQQVFGYPPLDFLKK